MTHKPLVDPPPDCLTVREARARGQALSPEAESHARACPACALETPDPPALELESLFAAVSADLAGEGGPGGRLRSLSTPARLTAAAGFAGALIAFVGVMYPRSRFAPMPVERVVLVVTSLAVLLAVTLRSSLRPLQARPSTKLDNGALALALLSPIVFAFGPFGPAFTGGAGASFFQGARACFTFGAGVGVLVVIALYVLDRGKHRSLEAALLAAAAGGLAANAALELHCPATDPAHLLLGHAAIAIVLVAAYGMLALRRER